MRSRIWAGLAVAVLSGVFSGCIKKVASTPPPPPYNASPNASTSASTAAPQSPARAEAAATTPHSRMPDAATRATIQELLNRIQDAYFDYDKHTLRPDAETALKRDAQTLSDLIRQYPDFKLTVEGHCDARGSEEYNLALGDARAKQAKEYLATLGLPENQLQLISYGKDRPVCDDQDEACWQKNRRAHLTQAQ
jgi:peptidoglycan-associated lipoprotein